MKRLTLLIVLLIAAPCLAQNNLSLFNRVQATPGAVAGDTYYTYDSTGKIVRRAIGSEGACYKVVSGLPDWAACSSLVSPLTTKGDLWGFSSADGRFPVGSNDKITIADSTATFGIRWDTLGSIGGVTGSLDSGYIPYATGAHTLDDTTIHWDGTNHIVDSGLFTHHPIDGTLGNSSGPYTVHDLVYQGTTGVQTGPCLGFRSNSADVVSAKIARICGVSTSPNPPTEGEGVAGAIEFQVMNDERCAGPVPCDTNAWTTMMKIHALRDTGGGTIHSMGVCLLCAANPIGRSYVEIRGGDEGYRDLSLTGFTMFSIGHYAVANLAFDRAGLQALNDGSAQGLNLNPLGGLVNVGASTHGGGLKLWGATSGGRTIIMPATGGTGTLTLPADHCAANEVWIDNGSGVMSCTSVAGGSLAVVSSDAVLTDLAPVIGDGGARKVKTVAALATSVGGTGANNAATSGRYLKGDGTNFVTSSGPASGTGSCTNQVVTALNSDAAPTCATTTSAAGGTGANNTATSGRYLKGDGTNFVTSSGSASGVGACSAGDVVTGLNSDASPTCASVSSGGTITSPQPGAAVWFSANSRFWSATSYMTVPDNTALDATTGVSVSLWMLQNGPSTANATGHGLFTKATAAGGTGAAACGDYTIFFTQTDSSIAGEIDFAVNGSGSCSWGAQAQYAKAPPRFGQWTHVVGTYSTAQGNAKLYINGILEATSGAYSTALNTTGTIAVIGAYFDKSVAARNCNCAIDDIRIWKNAALTSTDVTNLYRGGRGQFALNTLSANETVAWRFDNSSGTTDTDVVSALVATSAGATAVGWVQGIIPDK